MATKPPTFLHVESQALDQLDLEFSRMRCPPPNRVEAIRLDLGRNGQLTPLVARQRPEGRVQLLDGFKRVRAARALGWTELEVGSIEASDSTALVLMLSLNRRFGMSQVEEALVVQELIQSGLTGTEVGQLLGRHKTWISRRLGLVERLAPELQEDMKLGLLEPGVARRLLALPRGNQVELAAVVRSNGLGPRLTERLVALWRRAPTDEARQFVLTQPQKALGVSEPATMPVDPRLSRQGQRLQEELRKALQVLTRLESTLMGRVSPQDLPLLEEDIAGLMSRFQTLSCQLGRSNESES